MSFPEASTLAPVAFYARMDVGGTQPTERGAGVGLSKPGMLELRGCCLYVDCYVVGGAVEGWVIEAVLVIP